MSAWKTSYRKGAPGLDVQLMETAGGDFTIMSRAMACCYVVSADRVEIEVAKLRAEWAQIKASEQDA